MFNFNFYVKPNLTLQLHTRARTFEHAGAFNQFRAGPILMWQARPRFTVLSGYYFIEQNVRVTHQPYSLHRFWSGGQYRIYDGERWMVDGRSVVERFVAPGDDYWRVRNRAMLLRNTRVGQAFGSAEALTQEGIVYGRYTGGFQWKVHSRIVMGASYEYRDAPRGPGSHVLATFVQFDANSPATKQTD